MGFGAETGASGVSRVTRSTSFLRKALLPPRLAAAHSWTVQAEGLGRHGLDALCTGPCPCCIVPHCETGWEAACCLWPPHAHQGPNHTTYKCREPTFCRLGPTERNKPGGDQPIPLFFLSARDRSEVLSLQIFWRKLHMLSKHTC